MAYSVPFIWQHGDYPTAARMNLYKDGLDAVHDALGDYIVNPAVASRIAPVQGYYFLHHSRWLLYSNPSPSAGRIEDPAGVGATVTLAATAVGEWASYDLSQVDWLIPGKLYQVQAVIACLEDYEAL